jgi:hypothetical protein
MLGGRGGRVIGGAMDPLELDVVEYLIRWAITCGAIAFCAAIFVLWR